MTDERAERSLRRVLDTWKRAHRRMSRLNESDADKLARDIERLEQRLGDRSAGRVEGRRG